MILSRKTYHTNLIESGGDPLNYATADSQTSLILIHPSLILPWYNMDGIIIAYFDLTYSCYVWFTLDLHVLIL